MWMKFLFGKQAVLQLIFYIQVYFEIHVQNFQSVMAPLIKGKIPILASHTAQICFPDLDGKGKSRQFRWRLFCTEDAKSILKPFMRATEQVLPK